MGRPIKFKVGDHVFYKASEYVIEAQTDTKLKLHTPRLGKLASALYPRTWADKKDCEKVHG